MFSLRIDNLVVTIVRYIHTPTIKGSLFVRCASNVVVCVHAHIELRRGEESTLNGGRYWDANSLPKSSNGNGGCRIRTVCLRMSRNLPGIFCTAAKSLDAKHKAAGDESLRTYLSNDIARRIDLLTCTKPVDRIEAIIELEGAASGDVVDENAFSQVSVIIPDNSLVWWRDFSI